MLNVKLNDEKLDKKFNTAKTLSDTKSPNLLETQGGTHDMNTNAYGAVTLLPSLFFILGVMLIMSFMH